MQAIKRMPRNVAELCSFLGMINYYGRFIRNLSPCTVTHIVAKRNRVQMNKKLRMRISAGKKRISKRYRVGTLRSEAIADPGDRREFLWRGSCLIPPVS